MTRQTEAFDSCVIRAARALLKAGVPAPRALICLATGLDLLPERLERAEAHHLAGVDGVPSLYRGSRMFSGELCGSTVWVLEDLSSEPTPRHGAYESAFPIWLAAQSGARVLLHASAGTALGGARSLIVHPEPKATPIPRAVPPEPKRDGGRLKAPPGVSAAAQRLLQAAKARVEAAVEAVESSVEPVEMDEEPHAPEAGGLFFASDHLNVSGRSPLEGLGETRLGPLFPDQSRLHDPALRRAALELAQGRGLFPSVGVVACTPAPHLDTPAECRAWARLGASAAVQGLATPLIAAAHAGLSALAIVALIDGYGEQLAVRRLLERAEQAAPMLEEGLIAAVEALAGMTFEGEEEGEPRPLR